MNADNAPNFASVLPNILSSLPAIFGIPVDGSVIRIPCSMGEISIESRRGTAADVYLTIGGPEGTRFFRGTFYTVEGELRFKGNA
jgi:hypothetical protein